MNKARRERIRRIFDALTQNLNDLNAIHDEEEEYHDNIPENLLGSERAEASESAAESLSNAADSIQEALDYIEGII